MAEHPDVVDPQHPLVQRLREICLSYPETVEVRSWGRPTFRAGKKIFIVAGATMNVPLSIIFKPEDDERLAYLERARLLQPALLGTGRLASDTLDADDPDWTELAEIIDASYRQVALGAPDQPSRLDSPQTAGIVFRLASALRRDIRHAPVAQRIEQLTTDQ